MSTTTARHLTPPAPPAERDPFVRGPFLLELALTLVFTLTPIYYSGVVAYRWVYLADNTPPIVLAALGGMGLMTLVGYSLVGWLLGVRGASLLATWAIAVELGARRLWALHTRSDAGRIPLEYAIGIAVVLALVAFAVALSGPSR